MAWRLVKERAYTKLIMPSLVDLIYWRKWSAKSLVSTLAFQRQFHIVLCGYQQNITLNWGL
jgi:hypothetical protein